MKNLLTVAKFTFLEVYRSRLMISLIFLAVGLVLVSYIASEFAYGAPAKVSLDVGIGVMSISNLIIAVFIGSTLIGKEIEQRTLYMIISRPISRSSFLAGKVVGLSSVLLINSLVLGIVSALLFNRHGGEIQPLYYWTVYFSFIEAFTVLLFSTFFSLITNTTLTVIYTLVIFIVGHAINETSRLLFTKLSPFFSVLTNVGQYLLPNFYRLNLKDFLLYQQNVSMDYLLTTHLYIGLYLLALSSAIIYIFTNKNLD